MVSSLGPSSFNTGYTDPQSLYEDVNSFLENYLRIAHIVTVAGIALAALVFPTPELYGSFILASYSIIVIQLVTCGALLFYKTYFPSQEEQEPHLPPLPPQQPLPEDHPAWQRMEEMPEDILSQVHIWSEILGHAGFTLEDIPTIRLVCTKFNENADAIGAFLKYHSPRDRIAFTNENFQVLALSYPYIHELDLHGCRNVTNFAFLRCFEDVRVLDISSTGLQSQHLEDVAALTQLVKLNISNTCQDAPANTVILSTLSSLKVLEASNANFDPQNVGALGNLTKLTRLDLSDIPIEGRHIRSFIRLVKLEYLNLHGTHVDDDFGPPVVALVNLKFLSLRDTLVSDDFFQSAARLPDRRITFILSNTLCSLDGVHQFRRERPRFQIFFADANA